MSEELSLLRDCRAFIASDRLSLLVCLCLSDRDGNPDLATIDPMDADAVDEHDALLARLDALIAEWEIKRNDHT